MFFFFLHSLNESYSKFQTIIIRRLYVYSLACRAYVQYVFVSFGTLFCLVFLFELIASSVFTLCNLLSEYLAIERSKCRWFCRTIFMVCHLRTGVIVVFDCWLSSSSNKVVAFTIAPLSITAVVDAIIIVCVCIEGDCVLNRERWFDLTLNIYTNLPILQKFQLEWACLSSFPFCKKNNPFLVLSISCRLEFVLDFYFTVLFVCFFFIHRSKENDCLNPLADNANSTEKFRKHTI